MQLKGRKGRVFRHSVMQIKDISVFKADLDMYFVEIEKCQITRPLRPLRPSRPCIADPLSRHNATQDGDPVKTQHPKHRQR